MINLIEQIKHGQHWEFHGGIHPLQNKHQSSERSILPAEIPREILLPLKQHMGTRGQILVSVGERLLKGQPLTKSDILQCVPVHAPTSGQVIAIEPRTIPHPSGLTDICIVIRPDFNDEWCDKTPIPNYLNTSPEILINHIRNMGISGMGGAGFPTARKLQTALARTGILIINGAECEPYITADDRLMREHANEIIEGLEILRRIVKPALTVLAVEDNKPEAIAALQKAIENKPDIIVQLLPTKYPCGAERQLIKIVTGKEVPSGTIPTSIGLMVQNIGTVFAIKRAVVNGEPLIERVVTITGNTLKEQRNRWVLLGTPVRDLLNKHGFQADTKFSQIIIGGPMMGFTLPHLDIPITKMTNCVLAPTRREIPPSGREMACIRCSACAQVCPASLLPQQLFWYAKNKDYDKCKRYNLTDCIECGACSYVCPSQIPLVQYYRQAKAEIRTQDAEKQAAKQAKVHFDAKKIRIVREKEQRAARQKLAAENRRQNQQETTEKNAIAAAIARVKARKSAQELRFETEESSPDEELDKKPLELDANKQAIATAIARAKARKAAQSTNDEDK